ncbi:Glutaredoxin 4 [Nymphon striatum]|nr:Glutaredoxin 4 [Nymphon striatum]
MSRDPYISDINLDEFEDAVIKPSYEKPVLLDFWAEWCSPCLFIAPVLKEVIHEFEGNVLLAKLEVDEGKNMKLAGEYQVRGFPTIILFEEEKVMDVMDRIKDAVEKNPVIVFMKGTPQLPQCGFSSRTAQALMGCGEEFAFVNVLTDPEIFENLPRFADWPTFPQVYINGELIGGCDITLEMFEKGELQTMIKEAAGKEDQADS